MIFLTKNEYIEYLKINKLSDETARTYFLRLKKYSENKDNINYLDNKGKTYLCQTKNAIKYYYRAKDIYYNEKIIELSNLHRLSKKDKRNIDNPTAKHRKAYNI